MGSKFVAVVVFIGIVIGCQHLTETYLPTNLWFILGGLSFIVGDLFSAAIAGDL